MGQLLDELGKLSKLQIVRLGCHHVGTLLVHCLPGPTIFSVKWPDCRL